MTRRHFFREAWLLCALLLSPAGAAGQGTPAAQPTAPKTLIVDGDVRTPLSPSPAELKTMPRTRVEAKGEDGRAVSYEGVLVGELLKRAGATPGPDLRGDAVATYVLASASDGYQVVFSLAEIDPGFTSNDIIVTDTIDGKPLFAYQGSASDRGAEGSARGPIDSHAGASPGCPPQEMARCAGSPWEAWRRSRTRSLTTPLAAVQFRLAFTAASVMAIQTRARPCADSR